MARRRLVLRAMRLERRLDLRANPRHPGNRASWVEAAPRRWVDRRRYLPFQADRRPLPLDSRVGHRDRGQTRLAVGILGEMVNVIPVRGLDHLADYHDGDPDR